MAEDSLPFVFRPQTKEELYADLDLALEQIERGECIPLEQFEKEIEEEFNADMERSWQEMLNGGGTPFEEFWEEFEKEYK